MDTIQQRIGIFLNAAILTEEEAQALTKWVCILRGEVEACNTEILERMVTHCAMMMKRQREKEEFAAMPEALFDEICHDENYKKSVAVFEKMNAVYPVGQREKNYLILHICSLFAV